MVDERTASAGFQFVVGTVVVVLLDVFAFDSTLTAAILLGVPVGVGIAISRYVFWPADEE